LLIIIFKIFYNIENKILTKLKCSLSSALHLENESGCGKHGYFPVSFTIEIKSIRDISLNLFPVSNSVS